MTKYEYEKKRAAYATSTAPLEVREKAIRELDAAYYGMCSLKKAALLRDIKEGESDISDIKGSL